MADGRDAYLYPDVKVLRNKLGIKNTTALEEAEQILALPRTQELAGGEVDLGDRFDLEHLKAIHRHVFQDLYDWAGETRDVRRFTGRKGEDLLGKDISIEYPAHDGTDPDDHLATRLDYAFDRLAKDRVLRDPTTNGERYVERLAHHVAEVWECHAFREGNTRTTALFATALARSVGRPFERTLLRQDGSLRDALVLATGRNEYGPLRALIADGFAPRERGRTSAGKVLELEPRLAADIERARQVLKRSTARWLERVEQVHSDDVVELERTAAREGRALQVHLEAEPRGGRPGSTVAHESWAQERDRLQQEADIASGNAQGAREQFAQRGGARYAKAAELAGDDHRAEAALVRRAKAFETVRRVHRDLVAMVARREKTSDPREAERHDRRINDLATTLAKKAEHRMALDPVARRFVQYTQVRSGQALARVKVRERSSPGRSL